MNLLVAITGAKRNKQKNEKNGTNLDTGLKSKRFRSNS